MCVVRNTAVLVILGLTLGAPLAWAAPPQPETTFRAKPSLLGSMRMFAVLWQRTTCLIVPGSKEEGCAIDPWGNKVGAWIDPLGGAQPENVDSGCGIDPFGRCEPGH